MLHSLRGGYRSDGIPRCHDTISTLAQPSDDRVRRSARSTTLHGQWPLPPAPWRRASLQSQLTPDGPTGTIARFHENSSLIDGELQRNLFRRSADGKTAKHPFTSSECTCRRKPRARRIALRHSGLFTCRRVCTLFLSHPTMSNWLGSTSSTRV